MRKTRRATLGILTCLTLTQIAWPIDLAQAQAAENEYIVGIAENRNLTSVYRAAGTATRNGIQNAAFAESGMVKSVKVKVGDKVAKGDVLATLNTDELKQRMLQAQAALLQAQASLYSTQHPASMSAPSAASSTSKSNTPSIPVGTTISPTLLKSLTLGLAALDAASKAESEACAPGTAPEASSEAASEAVEDESATAEKAACAKATKQLTEAINKVTALQKKLNATAKPTAGSSKPTATSAKSSASKSVTPTVSKAAVARGKAQVLRAKQEYKKAKADLSAATLKASKAGVVAQVDLIKGTMSVGSIIVVSDNSKVEVALDVPLSVRKQLEVGSKVSVIPLSSSKEYEGEVTAISPLAAESTSPPQYPITITVLDPENLLFTGAPATIELPTGKAENAVAIPVSALTPLDSEKGAVDVFDTGSESPRTTLVTYGITNDGWVEIKEGIQTGQQVVLADLSIPLSTT